jgi:endoglucanase
VCLLAAATGCSGNDDGSGPEPESANPFAQHEQYDGADPALVAAAKQEVADGDQDAGDLLTRMDGVPTGLWLTPERYPTPDAVSTYVTAVAADAEDGGTDEVPVFVVYGIPDRDCTGGESAGGLAEADYLPWVQAIATAAGDTSVAIVEPDALPAAIQCNVVDQRVALLEQAVTALHDARVTTYVDAGHSAWVTADQVAPLLDRVGVGTVRGFSTNVSNYQPTAAEAAYAAQLSGLLGSAHYVIDTSRNGIGGGAVTDWCNPPGQALGREPAPVDDGSALDAYVWVKPPGESDGTCNGGPAAGQLWPERAVELATAAGW